jgi:hypothetical protein
LVRALFGFARSARTAASRLLLLSTTARVTDSLTDTQDMRMISSYEECRLVGYKHPVRTSQGAQPANDIKI